jgi:anti-sigma B factor antagonist
MGVLAMSLEMESGTEVLQIGVARSEGTVVITLAGELDVAGAPVLREHLAAATRSGGRVVCDLEHLTYMDSTGISVLIAARKRLDATGRDLVLVGPSERVHKVLKMTGVGSYFTIQPLGVPTEKDASG